MKGVYVRYNSQVNRLEVIELSKYQIDEDIMYVVMDMKDFMLYRMKVEGLDKVIEVEEYVEK